MFSRTIKFRRELVISFFDAKWLSLRAFKCGPQFQLKSHHANSVMQNSFFFQVILASSIRTLQCGSGDTVFISYTLVTLQKTGKFSRSCSRNFCPFCSVLCLSVIFSVRIVLFIIRVRQIRKFLNHEHRLRNSHRKISITDVIETKL